MTEISDKRRKTLAKLEKKIGYTFKKIDILDHTLMHKSYVNEHAVPGQKDNGVLEFLGDSILGFIISDFLYRAFPDLAEGKLSKIKAFLVSTSNLAQHSEKPSVFQNQIAKRKVLQRRANNRTMPRPIPGVQGNGAGQTRLLDAFSFRVGHICRNIGVEIERTQHQLKGTSFCTNQQRCRFSPSG